MMWGRLQPMTLAKHVRKGDWEALEDAWSELVVGDAPLEPALEAVEAAFHRKEVPRCVPFVKEHAQMLKDSGQPQSAADLLGRTMLLGGSPGELAAPLFAAASQAWSTESFWEAFVEISDLRENQPDMRAAWKAFKRLLDLEPGRAVYHAKGWGLGVIESLDHEAREVKIRFATERTDRFPFQTTIEIFETLAPDDLRALVILDPDELKRRLKEEPLDILTWILRRNRGRANHAGIKLAMKMLHVDGSRFTTWWKKARKMAENSAWYEVSGPATRVQVRLLDSAEDPAEGLRKQMRHAANLNQALIRAKNTVSGSDADEDMRKAALETLEELAVQDIHSLPHRLGTWLFLREERGATPELLTELLQEAAAAPPPPDPSKPPALWVLFQKVPGVREQERCIEILREVVGDNWLEEALQHMQHAAPGMARSLVDSLVAAGKRTELEEHYVALLTRTTRNPSVLIRLSEVIEKDPPDSLLPPLQRAQCLLQLAVYLDRQGSGDPHMTRARTRLSSLLKSGKPPLLERLLEGASLDALRGLASLIETGVERDVDRLFTKIAIAKSPDVFRGDERPFWEAVGTWTTRAGLDKREEELRILRDIKIPENSEAIGRAASFGDLSENSEWEAAIEEQRTLTTRAMDIEAEVRDAQLIENAPIPEGRVAPGTIVAYREVGSKEKNRVRILGPWDDDDDTISYRSPLAQGILGKRPGDRAVVTLPQGELEVEVLEIELLSL